MQLALNTIAPAPAPSATPGPAPQAAEQGAFAKALAARQRDAREADARQARAADARAQESRRQEAAAAGSAETAEPAPTSASDEADRTAAAPASPDTIEHRPAPALSALLAALNPPPADPPGVSAEGSALGAAAGAARGVRSAAARPPGGRHADTQPLAEMTRTLAEDTKDARATAAEATAAATDRDLASAAAPREAAPAAPATATAPLAALHSAPRAEFAAPPQAVTMTTPATAPEFREALGVQVSVLARGGVQQAELRLNPAEMGPISVQIALDGTQAQVQFGADSPVTRQLIEAGLPELAAALREAGFTLSGGGVSQHSRGQPDGAAAEHNAADRSNAAPADGLQATTAPPRQQMRLPLGAVDLYA